jgi:hypothetical protein
MTSFEYVTIPVSIVLALGIGKLLSGVFSMFNHEKRDWLFLTWCLTLLLLFLGQWYAIWRLQDNESWSMLEFVVVMLSPILYYSAAHLLVTDQPGSVRSWSEHLETVARPLLFVLILAGLNFNLRTYLVLGAVSFGTTALLIYPANCVAIIWPKRWMLTIAALTWLIPVTFLFIAAPDLSS